MPKALTYSPRIKQACLTPHFRNLLRADNPLLETFELLRWEWSQEGPKYRGELLTGCQLDGAAPAAKAIELMYFHIKTGNAALTILNTKFIR